MTSKQVSYISSTITNKVLELLEKGVVPWKKTWVGRGLNHSSYASKKSYRGYNALITFMTAQSRGYKSPFWLTLNQIKKLGGYVDNIKEVGVPVTFWNFKKSAKCKSCKGDGCKACNNTGKVSWKIKPWCKLYWIFNADEVKGLKSSDQAKMYPKVEERPEFNPIDECEKIWDNYKGKPKLFHDQLDSNYYIPLWDEIHLTEEKSFNSPSNYYATLFHEAGHSTGHKSRLNREGIAGVHNFGSHEYSKEELVAELTATILCGISGIEDDIISNSASYINSWSKKLKDNPDWFMEASSKAQRAVDHIMGVKYED